MDNVVDKSSRFSAWLARLLLASALAFGAEILLWPNPLERSTLEWALRAAGYLTLGTITLETIIAFRVRGVYGLMAVSGLYALMHGLLIAPETALADVPRTLFTRVMGASALVGFVMLVLFFRPIRLPKILALALAALGGAGWGAWARWSADVLSGDPSRAAAETPLITLLISAALALGVIALCGALLSRRNNLTQLTLRPLEWTPILAALITLTAIRSSVVDLLGLALALTLAAVCVGILYYLKRAKGASLADLVIETPPFAPSMLYAAAILLFALGAAFGHSLPRGDGLRDPANLISALLTAYGIVWLPALTLVIGLRAVIRQARAYRM